MEQENDYVFSEIIGRTIVSTQKVLAVVKINAISTDEFIQETDINSHELIKFDIEGTKMDDLRGKEQ